MQTSILVVGDLVHMVENLGEHILMPGRPASAAGGILGCPQGRVQARIVPVTSPAPTPGIRLTRHHPVEKDLRERP
ncbi:hypothetical protein X011_25770 [Mycobacterium tuberculosis variant microti OV254]|nr:hypothetical protein X011_25770 [Mycobacterium tuberculosis variant microti OV254]